MEADGGADRSDRHETSAVPRALVKPPSERFAQGLTAQNLGPPDLALARTQHAAYRDALAQSGFEVMALPEDDFGDSCFVEDMAVVGTALGDDGFVLATRSEVRGHEQPPIMTALRLALPRWRFASIKMPGRLDGGDVLRLGRRWFVGQTARTDGDGFRQFQAVVEAQGDTATAVEVGGLLHLKTGVSRLDDQTVLALPSLAQKFRDFGYRTLEVDPEDWHAANVLSLAGRVLIPAGYPRVVRALEAHGYSSFEVDLTEFKKQDGGASCLSILLP
jgi:dimethylargininase